MSSPGGKTQDQTVLDRYRRHYRIHDFALNALNVLGSALWPQAPYSAPKRPHRILLANIGHIGDAIISTGLLPVLHAAFPGIEIGFLTRPDCKPIVDGHPLLTRCHFIDYWLFSRTSESALKRIKRRQHESAAIIRDIKSLNYDIAIDLRWLAPVATPLISKTGIPVRIGYDRMGFRWQLTTPVKYTYNRSHELQHQLHLLRFLGISEKALSIARPCLPPIPAEARIEANTLLGETKAFRILHPASSTPLRDWTLAEWRNLATLLLSEGITPVITGKGPRDQRIADAIADGNPGVLVACNALSWNGLVALIDQAELVYSVETSIGHIASALHKPVLAIYGGTADPRTWAPINSQIATFPLECNPCLNRKGCASRDCLTRLTAHDVARQTEALLRSPKQIK